MSISLKDFRNGNFKDRVNKQSEHPVFVLLKNKKRAYKVKEIVKATGFNEATVRGMLSTLKKKNIIEHKVPYYAMKENNHKKSNKKNSKKKKGKKNAK